MRSLLLVLMCSMATAWAADPTTRPQELRACPATRADVKPGAACTATKTLYCDYDRGKWCACEASRCVTAAGPMPGCESTLSWVCRDDGCPHAGVTTCSTEGKQCGYDDGLCASSMVCKGGKWQGGRANCRPAAPPHP